MTRAIALAVLYTFAACSGPDLVIVKRCTITASFEEAQARLGSAIARCGLNKTEQAVFAFSLLAVAPCESSIRVCAADLEECENKILSTTCPDTNITCKLACR